MKFIPKLETFLSEAEGPWYYFSKKEILDIVKETRETWKEIKHVNVKEPVAWFRFVYNRADFNQDENIPLKYLQFKIHNLFLTPHAIMSLHRMDKVGGKYFDHFQINFIEYFPYKDELVHILTEYPKYFDQNEINGNLIVKYLSDERTKDSKRLKGWENYWNEKIQEDPRLYDLIKNSKAITPNIKPA